MPIYEYVCKDCNVHFEVFTTSIQSAEVVKCKECNSLNVKKTISASSFRLGNSGSSIPSGALSGCSPNSAFK